MSLRQFICGFALITLLCNCSTPITADNAPFNEESTYKCKVFTTSPFKQTYRAYLVRLKDSSIVLNYSDDPESVSDTFNVPVNDISRIKFSEKGKLGRQTGTLIGIGAGLTAGVVIPLAIISNQPSDPYGLTALGAILVVGLGASVGVIVGGATGALATAKKHTSEKEIYGSITKYNALREEMRPYILEYE